MKRCSLNPRAEISRRNRQELIRARLSRRELFKLGLLTGAGLLVAKSGLSSRAHADDAVRSPPTTPFVDPLPIPPRKQPVAALDPAPTEFPNTAAGEARTRPHQQFARFAPRRLYETHQREAQHSFSEAPGNLRNIPRQPIWGYDGIIPGPTFHARYGEPILVRQVNELPQNHVGFGSPQVSTHLHNAHTASESDGFPCDFFPQQIGGPGRFYDHLYANALAGFAREFPPAGDPREALSTLWLHDHRIDFTAQNVYKGLAGFYLLFNDFDSGDETTGFRLPSGDFDVPMFLADKVFDPHGELFFDLFNLDGVLGDKFLVNGKLQPFFTVERRRYRLRWLNGGPSRYYQLFLTDPGSPGRRIGFEHIANDGNLGVDVVSVGGRPFGRSLAVDSVRLAVAERADVVVDFAQFPAGTSLLLENRLIQKDGRGPTDQLAPAGQGDALLRFDVVERRGADQSRPPPYTFYELPLPSPAELSRARRRSWRFDRQNGQWTINGELFDCETPRLAVSEGAREVWTLHNSSGGWQHPIHLHCEECLLLSRNGRRPPAGERGRKDVVNLGFGEEVQVFMRFRDFFGRYPMHCHNTLHEDHAMMLRFDIV